MLYFQYCPASVAANSSGVFIPIATLPGLTTEELTAEETYKDSKCTLALVNQLQRSINGLGYSPLGLLANATIPVGIDMSTINQSYSLVYTRMVNEAANTVAPVPLATSGLNAGNGMLSVAQVFSGATAISAGEMTGGAGIVIPTVELQKYGCAAHANVELALNEGRDDRNWIASLFSYLANEAVQRSEAEASAVLSSSKISAIFTPLPEFTDEENPTSGLTTEDLIKRSFYDTFTTITMELLVQGYEVKIGGGENPPLLT